MAVANLGLLGTGSATTAGTTIAVTNTTGAIIPTGTLIHITGCWDNIASVTAPTITCSTVGGATATVNHATAIGSGVTTTAGAGIWHSCVRVLTTANIAIGGTIATLTSNQSAVVRAANAHGWSGSTSTLRGTVATGTSTTGAPSVATTGTALVTGDLVIGSVSFENNAQMTADADTLNGSWTAIVGITTTGGGAAANVGVGSQGKVVTATGVQTYNPTGGVADTVGCVYSVQPVPDPSGGAITYVAGTYTTYGTAHTSTVVTKPAGTVDGDFLIVGVATGLQTAATVATQPAGWTPIGTPTSSTDGNGFNVKFQVFWKIASGEGASWTWTHATQSSGAIALTYRGVNATTPLDATTTTAAGQGTTSTWASITTVTDNAWIVGFEQDWADTTNSLTPSAGFTERVEGVLLYTEDKVKTPAGASGTFAHTNNTSATAPWVAWTLALRPAPAGSAVAVPRNIHLPNPMISASFIR